MWYWLRQTLDFPSICRNDAEKPKLATGRGTQGEEDARTSGIPAASSQLISLGLCISIFVLTAMYSAYAPPYARPKTSSPTLKSSQASEPKLSITPENSTPRVEGACGGTGYLPSRWRRSMRLRPKASMRMMASLGLGTGLGMEVM